MDVVDIVSGIIILITMVIWSYFEIDAFINYKRERGLALLCIPMLMFVVFMIFLTVTSPFSVVLIVLDVLVSVATLFGCWEWLMVRKNNRKGA
jgi:hypothetical protein